MRTISPAEHFNAVQKHVNPNGRAECFAQPHETQDAAIKRLMAGHKRAWNKDHKTKASFPIWHPDMTTAAYVALFEQTNKLVKGACNTSKGGPLDRKAPAYTGPEVVAEVDQPELLAA